MVTRILLSIFLLAGALSAQSPPIEPGVSQELAKWRAARYSDIRYKLNLTLVKMSPVLKGTIEIRVRVGAQAPSPASPPGGEIPPIILDWRRIRGHEEKSTISNVSLNGVVLSVSPLLTRGLSQPGAQVGSGGATYLFSQAGDKSAQARASARAIADRGYEESNEHLIFRDGVVLGENVIKLDFTSPILTSGSAITRYIDKEDGSEYIYSLFVPSDASTAFPVFDQPDLKARIALQVSYPKDWRVVSNVPGAEPTANETPRSWTTSKQTFEETGRISTYVFAFAAGPFANFREDLKDFLLVAKNLPLDEDEQKRTFASLAVPKGQNPTFIYVRKSQAAKFKPHAAEVFRLNREAIKYFEQYFDYKFPFPKYDLVLIPEFPFGGMEHAGATFLRESAIIFPQEPTLSDHISRALLIFHEASHQWFGDTVTMKWFDDLWLKEGFATFTAYKALEKIMPSGQAWKVFYERVKQAAYQTDSTKGTTAIYQPIANLSAAKSAYGNIVYNKAPAFLRQAEFYIGPDKFQTAVRTFLKKHEYGNAGWEDLVSEFEKASGKEELRTWWAEPWVKHRGMPLFDLKLVFQTPDKKFLTRITQRNSLKERMAWSERTRTLILHHDGKRTVDESSLSPANFDFLNEVSAYVGYTEREPQFVFPNYGDYGYGIFLLDDKSRDYVLKNVQNEKDPFLRSMMWGALWDSVREGELDPRVFVELVIRQLGGPAGQGNDQVAKARASARAIAKGGTTETDEIIVASLVGRVSLALSYYMRSPDFALADGRASATGQLRSQFEAVLLDRMQTAPTAGQRITFFRAFVNNASTEKGRAALKQMLAQGSAKNHPVGETPTPLLRKEGSWNVIPLRAKDKFDIVTRLAVLGDADAVNLLAELEKTETGDDAKRYAYAARAGFATAENKAKYWNDFVNNSGLSESWIEATFGPWNSIRHNELTLPYLQKALQELPNHKRNRKIFFVNGWLAAFLGGQRSEEALSIVNKFLADNPSLDNDLRLKILENVDLIERAVKIRGKYGR